MYDVTGIVVDKYNNFLFSFEYSKCSHVGLCRVRKTFYSLLSIRRFLFSRLLTVDAATFYSLLSIQVIAMSEEKSYLDITFYSLLSIQIWSDGAELPSRNNLSILF